MRSLKKPLPSGRGVVTRMEVFDARIAEGNLEAAQAAKRLIDRTAANLELKVWRYASRIIMEGF
jgi:hypothetical protein